LFCPGIRQHEVLLSYIEFSVVATLSDEPGYGDWILTQVADDEVDGTAEFNFGMAIALLEHFTNCLTACALGDTTNSEMLLLDLLSCGLLFIVNYVRYVDQFATANRQIHRVAAINFLSRSRVLS